MPENKEPIVSAQVILHPASGQTIDNHLEISSATIAGLAPSPRAVAAVTAELRSKGFEIGPLVGISFSVTGPVRVFEEVFGMHIRPGNDRGYEFVADTKNIGHELIGDDLPGDLREFVYAVAFPLPPDFGPTDFHY